MYYIVRKIWAGNVVQLSLRAHTCWNNTVLSRIFSAILIFSTLHVRIVSCPCKSLCYGKFHSIVCYQCIHRGAVHVFTANGGPTLCLLLRCVYLHVYLQKQEFHSHTGARTRLVQAETRMIKVVSTLLGFYTISWIPFMIYEILIMTCDPDKDDCDDYRYFR